MSFVRNDNVQLSLFDKGFSLSTKEIQFLKKSYAFYFSEYIFPKIDESPFSVLYSDSYSRPNTPVNVQIGALILKELTHSSDEEILLSLMFDYRMQYALHTTSFKEQPMSDRTLGRFRARCLEYERNTGIDLIGNAIKSLSKEIENLMNIDTGLKRMDSMMIEANIKRLSRTELVYTTIKNVVKEIKEVPKELEHYLKDSDYNDCFYHKRYERNTSDNILDEASILNEYCKEKKYSTNTIDIFNRVLEEQTIVEEGSRRFITKEDGIMNSSIVQSPVDIEATFRHKNDKDHVGYIANFIESEGAIIEDYDVKPNNYSDSRFLKDTLDRVDSTMETTIVADGGYSGYDNQEKAVSKNVNLITTNLTGNDTDLIYTNVEFDDKRNEIKTCPFGNVPTKSVFHKKGENYTIYMNKCDCDKCQLKDRCNPKETQKHYTKIISKKMKQRAAQKEYRSTEEFKKYSHFRNGVEAIPSLLRRKYYVDKIPVHGRLRTKLYFGFKIAAINITRFCKFKQNLYCHAKNEKLG